MACFHPLKGFQVLPDGGFFTSEHKCRGRDYRPMSVGCGQCIGCKLDRSLSWGVRCVHESKLHAANSFVTLTYDEKKLPRVPLGFPTLRPKDLVDFHKRLRHHLGAFRYYGCGEYGGETARPHYHVCLFGMDFKDKRHVTSARGYPEWQSDKLDAIWGHGGCRIGEVNRKTACYTARYICEKVNGDPGIIHYAGREPEFSVMSTKPGIGARWLFKFYSDVFPHGKVLSDGFERKAPKYYDKLLDRREVVLGGDVGFWLRVDRMEEALLRAGDSTEERLAIREEFALLNLKRFSQKGGV